MRSRLTWRICASLKVSSVLLNASSVISARRASTLASFSASPLAVPTPQGAEGWQDLYAYSLPFSDDRRDLRLREAELVRQRHHLRAQPAPAGGVREAEVRAAAVLSLLVTLGYFGVLIGMMTQVFKVTDSQALLIMLGSLGTAWGMVMAFWFGTTRSSQDKTEILAKSPAVK